MPEYLYQQAGTPDQSHQPQTPAVPAERIINA